MDIIIELESVHHELKSSEVANFYKGLKGSKREESVP